MDAKDEVKKRVSVEEVVADYLELKRAGRNFKAKSPWTNERTASFMVSPDKQIWHDFSSNKGGDIFSFIMEMEGVDFRQALEILARKAGIDLADYSRGDGTAAKKKKRIYEAHELAVTYYHQTLAKNNTALDYVLNQRGYTKDTVKKFKIGYAPRAGNALFNFLTKRKFSQTELKEAGLATQRGGDMFRGRVVLPLADGQGRYVGFTGRILEDNVDAPKYLNTPQTLVYDKGRQAYGLHLAKESIRENNFAIVVEGNLDVVASHQAGVANVVAAAGTALTNDHLKQLSRLTPNIKLAFDSDRAGLAATERAIGLAQGLDIKLDVIDLPRGYDPDDVIQQNPKKWLHLVEHSKYVLDWLIQHLKSQYDLETATGKKAFTDKVITVLKRLEDPVEQEHYLKETGAQIGTTFAALKKKLESTKEVSAPKRKPKNKLEQKPSESDPTAYEDTYLALNVSYPDVRESLSRVDKTQLSTDQRRLIHHYMSENINQELHNKLPEALQEVTDYVNILILKAEELYSSWSSSDRLIEAIGLARRITSEHHKKMKNYVSKAIRQAEESGDSEKASELLETYSKLLKDNK